MNDIVPILRIDNKAFVGWKAIRVQQSINRFVGNFAMSYTDNYPYQTDNTSFRMGQQCYVEINGNRLITGYIEEMDIAYNKDSHSLNIRGRDKLGDLIDCTNYGSLARNEFKNQTILSIIQALCKPFSITVEADDSALSAVAEKPTKAGETWKIREGDTIQESIIELCRKQAILPISQGDGKLILTRTTNSENAYSTLELGKNVLSGKMVQSDIERFSDYVLKGYSKAGDDLFDIGSNQAVTKIQQDELIDRHRPTTIIIDDVIGPADLQKKAQWEASTRAGNSRKFYYTVNGWLQENGKPWKINTLVKIKDPINKFTGFMLIVETNFSLSKQSGMITELTIMHPDAFKLIKTPEEINTQYDIFSLNKRVGTGD